MAGRGAHTTTRHHGVNYAPGAGRGASFPLGGLWEPDFLSISQWFDRQGRGHQRSGAQMLMLAVLESAWRDVVSVRGGTLSLVSHRGRPAGRQLPKAYSLYDDAVAWFASDDASWPFSFVNICDVLGLEASYVRRGLGLLGGAGAETQRSGSSPGRDVRVGRAAQVRP